MNKDDYVLLRDLEPLTAEEYEERISIYKETTIEERIEIHKKCIFNIVHYLSRIGMDAHEIGKLMKVGFTAYEKLIKIESYNNEKFN